MHTAKDPIFPRLVTHATSVLGQKRHMETTVSVVDWLTTKPFHRYQMLPEPADWRECGQGDVHEHQQTRIMVLAKI